MYTKVDVTDGGKESPAAIKLCGKERDPGKAMEIDITRDSYINQMTGQSGKRIEGPGKISGDGQKAVPHHNPLLTVECGILKGCL